LVGKIVDARSLRTSVEKDEREMQLAAFTKITEDAVARPMKDVAPLVRRPVKVVPELGYPELGLRSFGKGTFHKPALLGINVGTKKLFEIHPGDLVFSNVFAWEGAVGIARNEDAGRFGSHRFMSCVPKQGVATSPFLRFYFSTEKGLKQLKDASPGGAGRNRTLGIDALGEIVVPVPAFERQLWFDGLQERVTALKHLQSETDAEMDALLPSILDKAFRGDL